MARVAGEMTLAQLEKALEKKKSRLDELQSRRATLQQQLARVEAQISGIAGRSSGAGGVRKRRKRPKNAQSLKGYVSDILGRNKKGLTLAELHEKLDQTDYRSKAKNFRNVLYQCLYNSEDFQQDKSTGKYSLKS
jgi:hypothetical protein